MQQNQILTLALVLLIGVGLGYFFAPRHAPMGVNSMPGENTTMGGESMMHDSMEGMVAALNGKTGDAFDEAFLAEMIAHHEGAVEMAEAALANAKHQELKDMAQAIISAQTVEIDQMKAWQRSWYGN